MREVDTQQMPLALCGGKETEFPAMRGWRLWEYPKLPSRWGGVGATSCDWVMVTFSWNRLISGLPWGRLDRRANLAQSWVSRCGEKITSPSRNLLKCLWKHRFWSYIAQTLEIWGKGQRNGILFSHIQLNILFLYFLLKFKKKNV